MKKFLTKTNDYTSVDIVIECECCSHLLRVTKYTDEEEFNLMCYSCSLPENATKKNLVWDVILNKKNAMELANSILDIYNE